MLPQWIIEKKRDGNELLDEEIHFFIDGFTDGTLDKLEAIPGCRTDLSEEAFFQCLEKVSRSASLLPLRR